MKDLKIRFENCYGIQSLDYNFEFSLNNNPNKPKQRAYAIYAPNGLMKSSFAKTFDDLSKGRNPSELRFNRPSSHSVEADGVILSKDSIYVLKSEIDISSDSPAITNILVNPVHKSRYDELLLDLDQLKAKLTNALQKKSKLKKNDIENTILDDFNNRDFYTCLKEAKKMLSTADLTPFEYATIFDQKVISVIKDPNFIAKANEFNERYQELFNQAETIYQKGVFNPARAETSFSTLDKQGFFRGGHKVHLKGEAKSIDKAELDQKIQAIHAKIDADQKLKAIRLSLAKNAQTQALADLIEQLSSDQIDFLLENVKPANQTIFRQELWAYYIQNCLESDVYLEAYTSSKDEIAHIESAASQVAPRWSESVKLFNERFIDMPFTLEIANPIDAALGKAQAKLKFIFRDGEDIAEYSRSDIKTLSQGEKRALYLLNFIFEVEARKLSNQETIFILDDVADSFDYKNKHAIVQYLEDLCTTDYFYQIILTHNFDFFRALNYNFVRYDRCLMANKATNKIELIKADGIRNYFTGKWKPQILKCDKILCATIPFVRNLIEYTKGENDVDYLKLTSLLHWKSDSDRITVGDYLSIYNNLFNSNHAVTRTQSIKDLLFEKADEICGQTVHDGINLEDKVLLSIAIRFKSEIFSINKIRQLKNDGNYWCVSKNQFGILIQELKLLDPAMQELRTLEKVSVTVSSNIHLNSFMYEPILDLSIEHLIALYTEVKTLCSQ